MPNPRLKKYLEISKDPNLALLRHLEQMEEMAKNIAERVVSNQVQDLKKEYESGVKILVKNLEKQIPILAEGLTDKLTRFVLQNDYKFRGKDGVSVKGDKGEKGDKGDKGEKGDPGTTPIPGIDFPSMIEIEQIIKSHIPKENKKNPLNFKEIARGLESLPTKEKLDYKVGLKNQPKDATSIQAPTRSSIIKGGGMGNWIHQRWSISSATTTLSLNFNIASDGEAHIFRYNGQVQDLDTDYTISGKTITLLFTPQDGTVASIAYVRK